MKKGFTLMEVLFVVLVIALVLSFALPAFRSVRYDVQNSRAKNALKKLAEARRSYYQYNRGVDIAECGNGGTAETCSFLGTNAQTYAGLDCTNQAASGVPSASAGTSSGTTASVRQLFACHFLDWKDFQDLNYTFQICPKEGRNDNSPCHYKDTYAGATGANDNAGPKYKTPGYFMYIKKDLQVRDTLDNED